MNNTIIKLEHVSKEYHRGTETVHAVSRLLSINKGEFVAILGHSGSGKPLAQYYRLP